MKKSDVLSSSGSISIKTTGTSPSLTGGIKSTSSSGKSITTPKPTGTKPPLLSKSESSSTLTPKVSPSLTGSSTSISGSSSTVTKKTSTIGSSSTKTTPPTLSKGLSTPNLPSTKRSALSTSSSSKLSSTSSSATLKSTTVNSSTSVVKPKTTSTITSKTTPVVSSSTKKPPVSTTSRPTTTTSSRPLTSSSSGTSSQQPQTTKSTSKIPSATHITTRSNRTNTKSASNLKQQLQQEQEQEQEQEQNQKILPQQLSINIPFEEFDPITSPEFENVAKEFILLDDDVDEEEEEEDDLEEQDQEEEEFDNVIDLDRDDENGEENFEEEIFEEEENQEVLLQNHNKIINLDEEEDFNYDTDDYHNLKDTQTLYSNGGILENQPQIPDTTPMDIPNSTNNSDSSKPIEIKKSSSWMSSFFTKITKSTTSMISTSLSSSTTTTTLLTSSTTLSQSPLLLSTENPVDTNENNLNNQLKNTNGDISNNNTNNSNSISEALNNNSNIQQLKTLPPPNMMYSMHNNQLPIHQPMHNNHIHPHHQPIHNNQLIHNNNPNHHQPIHNNHAHPHQLIHNNNPNHHQPMHNNHLMNQNNNRYSQNYQNRILPHNQPGGLALLPFTINSHRAISIFQDWYKSLWFAPTDFKEKIEPTLKIYKYFVPYYVFSCVVHSVHSGKVGFIKPDDPNQQSIIVQGNDEQKKKHREKEEIEWMNGSTNPYTQSHNDILIYSPVTHSVDSDPPIYIHIKEINDWRIDSTEPFHSQHPQLLYPNYVIDHQQTNLLQYNNNNNNNQPNPLSPTNSYNEVENSQLTQLPLVINKLDWDKAWIYAENKIKKNEIYGNDSKLKRDYQAHLVKDVETETKFENISYRTIYAPVYKLNYKYDGKDYSFVVNGQTGKRYSPTRPFGVGSIKTKAIKILTGGVFSSEKTKSLEMERKINNNMVKGSDLNEIDQVFSTQEDTGQQIKLYKDDHFYLLLPNSDQFLLLKTTGYIILRNSSKTESLGLQSHKRMTDETGGTCILEPNETQTFAYRGSWCIEILEGDNNSLELIKVETNSGSDKSFGDLLMQ